MYILIEGIDGSGKSTMARELNIWMENEGYDVRLWQEPYIPEIHNLLKMAKELEDEDPDYFDLVKTDLFSLLFSADRMLMGSKLSKIADEQHIIADRSFLSTMAYQYDSGLDFLDRLSKWIVEPDLILILDIDPDIAIKRIRRRDSTEVDYFEKVEFLENVRSNYHELMTMLPYPSCLMDANNDFHVVFDACKDIIERYLQYEDCSGNNIVKGEVLDDIK